MTGSTGRPTGGTTTGGGTGTSRSGYVTNLAGSRSPSGCSAYGADFRFQPFGITLDATGDAYVATSQFLDLVTPDGGLHILISAGPILESVQAPALGSTGEVYVSSPSGFHSAMIYRIAETNLTTFAGNGVANNCDDSSTPNGVGFINAEGMATDSLGNLFITDSDIAEDSPTHGCTRIRRVAVDGTTTTLAGEGTPGFQDGPGGQARFNNPQGIAIDGSGSVYVADTGNNRIRKILPDGTTTTLAGNGLADFVDGSGGPDGTASFNAPAGIAVGLNGEVYVADTDNNSIREISPSGDTTTLAGNGTRGSLNGSIGRGGSSEFDFPLGLAVADDGDIYVTSACVIRVIHLR